MSEPDPKCEIIEVAREWFHVLCGDRIYEFIFREDFDDTRWLNKLCDIRNKTLSEIHLDLKAVPFEIVPSVGELHKDTRRLLLLRAEKKRLR